METWNSTCYDIDMKDGGRRRYCNVTDLWQPTITKTDGYVAAICIFIFAVVVTIVSLRRMKFLKDLCCVFGRDVGCCTLSSFVFAVIAGAVWKIADVIIDCFTFYRLGSGSLIDGLIYRNGHVLNSIVAFTVVGVVGMILRFRLVHLKADDIQNKQDVQTVKLLLVLISFCLEDSVQMFLEYFWIQKYVTINIPTYLVIKDTIIAILSLFSLVSSILLLRQQSSRRAFIFFAFGVIINIAEYLRISAVIKQYRRGSFEHDCLTVRDGRLWQTPFNGQCLTSTDKWIVALTFVPFAAYPFLVEAFKSDIQLLFSKSKCSSTELLVES
eukprot:TCONS_00069451-protein